MVNYCKSCGEPIRFFRGYQKDAGEICFTCYLEHLASQMEPEKVMVKAAS